MTDVDDGSFEHGQDRFESDYEYESSSAVECDSIVEAPIISASLFNQEPVSCSICCDDKVEQGCALILPSCFHSFCVECFNHYLEVQIGEGNADNIACPFVLEGEGCGVAGKQCNATVELDVLREIMSRESYDRLVHMRDTAFVRKNVDYHHCPTPDCSNVVLCKFLVSTTNHNTTGKEISNAEVSLPRICDCFKCGQTSCLTCGARPFHFNKTCEKHREEKRRERALRARVENSRIQFSSAFGTTMMHQSYCSPPDRSRADEETAYDFDVVGSFGNATNNNPNNNDLGVETNADTSNNPGNALLENIKRCRRCGNGVELQGGCLKMKCLCGYRFCYRCGSENARCDCTPSHHGFTDNMTGGGDFAGLKEAKSYT